MAELTANFQSLKPSSSPLMDMDPNQNPSLLHNPNVNFLDTIPVLFNDSFFGNQAPPRFLETWGENFPGVFCQANQITAPDFPSGNDLHETKKRKLETDASECSSGNSTPQISETGVKTKNVQNRPSLVFTLRFYKILMGLFSFFMSALQSSSKGKRSKKGGENDDEKPREVVHVRARRGQATDSHSVAERVNLHKELSQRVLVPFFLHFENVLKKIQTLFSNR